MSRAAERVRCYNCGRIGPRDAPGCARCGATFGALCGCSAELSVYDDECGRCGADHVPVRVPTSKLPHVRAAKATALVLAVAATAWVAWARFGPRDKETWRLKSEGKAALADAEYATAAKLFRDVTDENPGDAEGWCGLAKSYLGMKFPADRYQPLAEHAVLLRDDYFDARQLLVNAEMERGHLDRAIVHAEKATHSPNATAAAWLLLARLELMRPRPNLAQAQRALERAHAAGRDTTEVKALLAEITLRLHGAVAGGAERLPARSAATLRSALAALEQTAPRDADGAVVSLTKARIRLALGDAEPAFSDAERALVQLPPDAPAGAAAEIKLVRAMALYLRGSKVDATNAFAEVLREAPDAATSSAIGAYLSSAGDGAGARAVLARAADTHDPKGAIHAVLATVLLSQNAVDDAAAAIDAAIAASKDDAFLMDILGSVRVAQGRFDEARAAYGRSAELAPDLVEPRVRLALVALAESAAAREAPGSADATRAKALADLQALRKQFGDDPFLLEGIGRMSLALGDVAAARTALESAAELWPADPDIWIVLADARRRSGDSGDADSLAAAAAAWGRARILRADDAAIALAEAEAWTDAGKYDVAVSACTEFLRGHPDAVSVLRARAGCFQRLEMWSLAAADLRRVRDLGTAGEADVGALVDALWRAGDAKAARQAADDAKGKVPTHVLDFLAALHGGDPQAAIARLAAGGPSLLLAELQLAAGRRSESTETLRRLAAAQPGDPLVVRLLVAELLGPEPVAAERIAESRALLASLAPDTATAFARLIEGRILLAEGRDADAVAQLREAERALPNDPFATLFLGEALFRTHERTESLALLRRAAALPGAWESVKAIVARRLLTVAGETGAADLDRRESLAREARRLDVRLVGSVYMLLDVLHARGEFGQAADVAEQALRTGGWPPEDDLKLRVAAASEHLLAGEFQAVEVHLDALPTELRESAGGRLLMGLAELGAGRIDAARGIFESLAAANPANADAIAGLIRIDLARGDRAAAVRRIEAWCAAHADDRDVRIGASRLLLREGYADDAVRFAEQCADRHPGDLAAAMTRATVLRRAGRPQDAVAALRRFAATATDASTARRAVATLAVQCGVDVPAALATARQVAADPAESESARIAGAVIEAEALLALGNFAEAQAAAQAALKRLDASLVGGHEDRMLKSRAHFVAGFAAASASPPQRTLAVAEFGRCLALDGDNLDVANDLAWVLASGGDAAAAAQALAIARRVTDAAPGDPNYWDTHAEVARRAGEPDEAESCWARSVDLSAASKRRDPARELRVALRFAAFLQDRKKPDAARSVAERVRPLVAGTVSEREIDRFLAGLTK